MTLDNFKRTKTHYCASNQLLGATSACVDAFEAEVDPASEIEVLVAEAVKHLPSRRHEEQHIRNREGVFPAFDADAHFRYYCGKPSAYDIKVDPVNQVAVFVLRSDTNGYGVYEGIYGLRRDGTRLYGELIAFNRRPRGADHEFNHRILSLEDGVVTYKTGYLLRDKRYVSYHEDVDRRETTYKYDLKSGQGDKNLFTQVPSAPCYPSAP